jgi:hypothetical protein
LAERYCRFAQQSRSILKQLSLACP